jgi:hypothetical protein
MKKKKHWKAALEQSLAWVAVGLAVGLDVGADGH